MSEVGSISGVVQSWNNEQGWGVIESPETPGGCWCHFSHLAMDGYRALEPGTLVEFLFEPGEQDGYHFRVVQAWVPGQRVPPQKARSDTGAYESVTSVQMDEPTGSV